MPQLAHFTISLDVEGDHFDPSGMFNIVSDIITPYVILTVTDPTEAETLLPVISEIDIVEAPTAPFAIILPCVRSDPKTALPLIAGDPEIADAPEFVTGPAVTSALPIKLKYALPTPDIIAGVVTP